MNSARVREAYGSSYRNQEFSVFRSSAVQKASGRLKKVVRIAICVHSIDLGIERKYDEVE